MRSNLCDLPPSARAAAFDPDLLRSRSVLIYALSSLVLSLLLYACIVTMLTTDLYVHLIRQAWDAFRHFRVIPGAVFIFLGDGTLVLGLALLAAVVTVYRRYPNVLKLLRQQAREQARGKPCRIF